MGKNKNLLYKLLVISLSVEIRQILTTFKHIYVRVLSLKACEKLALAPGLMNVTFKTHHFYLNLSVIFSQTKQWMIEDTDWFKDGLLKHVETPGLQGNANGLLVLVIIQATQEHLVDDSLQTRVNALFLLIFWHLSIFYTLLGVVVNAFGCIGKKKKKKKSKSWNYRIGYPSPWESNCD